MLPGRAVKAFTEKTSGLPRADERGTFLSFPACIFELEKLVDPFVQTVLPRRSGKNRLTSLLQPPPLARQFLAALLSEDGDQMSFGRQPMAKTGPANAMDNPVSPSFRLADTVQRIESNPVAGETSDMKEQARSPIAVAPVE